MTMETGARGAMNDAAITAIDQFIAGKAINKSQTNWKTRLPKPPMLTFDKAKKYYWEMDTNHGAIRIEPRREVSIIADVRCAALRGRPFCVSGMA